MCSGGAEGAGQALWPAGTAALPSARRPAPAQARATALISAPAMLIYSFPPELLCLRQTST